MHSDQSMDNFRIGIHCQAGAGTNCGQEVSLVWDQAIKLVQDIWYWYAKVVHGQIICFALIWGHVCGTQPVIELPNLFQKILEIRLQDERHPILILLQTFPDKKVLWSKKQRPRGQFN
jgi:hypothetical protein